MKFHHTLSIALLAVTFSACGQSKKAVIAENESLKATIDSLKSKTEVNLRDENQKTSYAIGVQIGDNFRQQGLDSIIDLDVLMVGLREAVQDTAQMNNDEVRATMQALSQRMEAIERAKMEKAAAENLKKGQDFLEENAKRAEVTTTESGLQYEVLVKGEGPIPTAQDRVKAHYTGKLLDGTVFDSSVGRQPFEASAGGGLIQGWLEALQMMPVGSKWKLFIPANLAYGQRGAGGSIGPNETLIFELELLEILGQ